MRDREEGHAGRRAADPSPLARRLIDALRGSGAGVLPVRSLDRKLAARVVRLVGTPLYGLSHLAVSIEDAVSLLGLDTVQRLALAVEVLDGFELTSQDAERGALRRSWLMQAVAARRLAVETGAWDPEEALLAGLLADCGALELLEGVTGYREVLARHYSGDGPLLALEREALGEDHAAATLRWLGRWGLPERICAAVRSRWTDPGGASQPGRILAAAALLAETHTVAGSDRERAERRAVELLDLPPALVASIAAGLPGELRQVIDALEPRPSARDLEMWPDPAELGVAVDDPTGLVPRDAFERVVEAFHDRAARLHRPLAVLVLEIGTLKNPERAPALEAGVLGRIARLVRHSDPNARVDQAQVAILAPGCGAGDVPGIAERIRVGLGAGGATDGRARAEQVVIGMAAADPHHDGSEAAALLASAYTALSRAELAPERSWVF